MIRYFDYTDLLGWHVGDLAAAMLASTIKIQGRLHDIEREGWRIVKYECVAAFLEPMAVRLDYRIALEKEDFPALTSTHRQGTPPHRKVVPLRIVTAAVMPAFLSL